VTPLSVVLALGGAKRYGGALRSEGWRREAASAMSDDNTIFREVDEDLRREQLAKLWNRYGHFVLIGAVLIVVVAGGYNVNQWWQQKQASENGEAYFTASELFADKKNADAIAAFNKLAQDGTSGYEQLAELRVAAIHAEEGRKADAVKIYDELSERGGDAVLRDFARLAAATIRVDEADYAEMQKRLDGLNKDTNPWRYSARELLALAAFRSGNTGESEKLYSAILGDPSAPAELRKRAEAMLALLVKASKQVSSNGPGDKDTRTQ
jgi:hypothetical protein